VSGECPTVKHVPGRKSDVIDCQCCNTCTRWGCWRALIPGRKSDCAIRSLLRHRDSLVQMAAAHVQHMQKATDQMNLQLHHVLSDITGQSGLAILDAILAVNATRSSRQLRHARVRRAKSHHKITGGRLSTETCIHLATVLAAYRYYQSLITTCDQENCRTTAEPDSRTPPDASPLATGTLPALGTQERVSF